MSETYTKVPNDILDYLAKNKLSDRERRIIMVILRKTYGFHKKEDNISLSQLTKLTNLDKSNLCKALIKLEKKCIIKRCKDRRITSYSFYSAKPVVKTTTITSGQINHQVVVKTTTQSSGQNNHIQKKLKKLKEQVLSTKDKSGISKIGDVVKSTVPNAAKNMENTAMMKFEDIHQDPDSLLLFINQNFKTNWDRNDFLKTKALYSFDRLRDFVKNMKDSNNKYPSPVGFIKFGLERNYALREYV